MASELARQGARKGGPRRLIVLAAFVVGVVALVVVLIVVQRRPPPIPEADPTPPKPQISRVDIERIVAVSLTGPGLTDAFNMFPSTGGTLSPTTRPISRRKTASAGRLFRATVGNKREAIKFARL